MDIKINKELQSIILYNRLPRKFKKKYPSKVLYFYMIKNQTKDLKRIIKFKN